MSGQSHASLLELCERIKRLGYTASSRIRIYGGEFDLVSDPFPDGEGVAMHVTARGDLNVRVLRFPVAILQAGKLRRNPDAA
jgi:hypothetical protein